MSSVPVSMPKPASQDGALAQKVGQERFFPQTFGYGKGIQPGGRQPPPVQSGAISGENTPQRTEQCGPEGSDLAFRIGQVLRRQSLREAFLHQVGQSDSPGKKGGFIHMGKTLAQVCSRFGQLAHAGGKQGDLIEASGLPAQSRVAGPDEKRIPAPGP